LKYIKKTGRTFNVRYEEYIHAIRNINSNSGYSNHILNTGHTYGTITDPMDIIRTGREGRHSNTLDSRDYLHMNDIFFFNLHIGGWNEGPLDTVAT
jgi:hypothetical protein